MATTAPAKPQPAIAIERRTQHARLVSLDAYRGLIMLMLISHGFGLTVLQSRPQWAWLAQQFDHAEWIGCTFWYLIQPAFTFMVGMAMPFALAHRTAAGATNTQLFRHVAWRALHADRAEQRAVELRLRARQACPSIDQRAVPDHVWLSGLFSDYAPPFPVAGRMRRGFARGSLALFAMFPGPDGPYSKDGNIGAVIDRAVLGYNYPGYYTTINFLTNAVTILFGCWAGMLVRLDRPHSYKIKVLATCAAAAFITGLALQPVSPMVKRLWTASFTLFSAGWVILMLIALYWLVDIKQYRRWAFPAIVLGMNSIFIYSFSQVLRGWLNRGLGVFTGNFWYFGDLGAIPQNIAVLTVMWWMCYWLYRRGIFLKI